MKLRHWLIVAFLSFLFLPALIFACGGGDSDKRDAAENEDEGE